MAKIIETRTEPCGTVAFTKLVVPHDWRPKDHRDVIRWSAGGGHEYADGGRCNGACR